MKWRALIAAVVLATLGWSAYWWVSASARDAALADWLAARRAEGWQAEAASIESRGFPNRVDTRIEGLALADPEMGWAWRAPFLEMLTLSYAPNRAVLVAPPEQTLAAPGATATLRAEDLRASVRLRPGPSLALTRFSAEAEALALEAEEGWTASARSIDLHIVEADPETTPRHGYRVFAEGRDLRPPPAVARMLDPADALPAALSHVTLDGRVAFDAPLDRSAVEDRPPGLRGLLLERAEAEWGGLELSARGELRADAEGFAAGTLDIRARNWRRMLDVAVAAGAIPRELAGAIETGLGLLAAFGGDDEVIEVPLVFRSGSARLGPIPVGPAPRLRRPG